MTDRDKLNLAILKAQLTGEEIAAGRSRFAKDTAGMSESEKAAFLEGLKLATVTLQFGIPKAAKMLSMLIAAGMEDAGGEAIETDSDDRG